MSIIKPFNGIIYNTDIAGDLNTLVAPPYDIISAERRRELQQRSPHNVVRLILAEDKPGDGPRANKYTRAAARWRQWLHEGVLVRGDRPALYRYQISFDVKTSEGIVTRSRPGLVALLKLHEYEEGKVLPHERTLAGPKQDRLQLMLHARANFSQALMLYPDADGRVDDALGSDPPAGAEVMRVEDDYGVTHTMWPVDDPAAVYAACAHIAQQKLYIADGHHRYETALALRRHLRQSSPLFAHGSDYIMTYFTPLEHPGLVIFPYHRILHHLPQRRYSGLLKKLEAHFEIERALRCPLDPGECRREFVRELERRGKERAVFGMINGLTRTAYFLSLKPDAQVAELARSPIESILSRLDVIILEELVLSGALGVKHKDLLNEKFVSYETDYDQTIAAVQKPPHQFAFLMNPTPIRDVITVANHRGIMPEKSTYFFPKVATGLVMYDMESGG